MIRIEALWACTAPVDMRAGADRLLACVVQTLGAAQAHHGWGVWCAARRLNAGHFVWPRGLESSTPLALTQEQFDALIVGLPWQRLHERRMITRV